MKTVLFIIAALFGASCFAQEFIPISRPYPIYQPIYPCQPCYPGYIIVNPGHPLHPWTRQLLAPNPPGTLNSYELEIGHHYRNVGNINGLNYYREVPLTWQNVDSHDGRGFRPQLRPYEGNQPYWGNNSSIRLYQR